MRSGAEARVGPTKELKSVVAAMGLEAAWALQEHRPGQDIGCQQGEVVQRPIQGNMMLVRPARLYNFYIFEAPRVT